MDHPYADALSQIGEFLAAELPQLSVNCNPRPEIDVGGTFRLDKGKMPEHLIKIDADVFDDHSPQEIIRQLRIQQLTERLKAASSKQKVRIEPADPVGILVRFEPWQL